MPLLRRMNGLSRMTVLLLAMTFVVGPLHHFDHVLRVDHSGWPFIGRVTPFTYSLLAYPILLFALLGQTRLFWLRWSALALGAAFTLYAHIFIESPRMQFAMWAYNRSLEPQLAGVSNLCGLQSPVIGVVAVVISMMLNFALVATTVSMLTDGLRRR